MEYILFVLVIIGLIILILSFFKRDSVKQLEEQIEGTSITMMQELYKVKKKIRLLEEEMMIEDK